MKKSSASAAPASGVAPAPSPDDDPGQKAPALKSENAKLRATIAELEESRRRYAELYDLAPIGYLTLDRAGRVLEANMAASLLLGPPLPQLIGAKLTDFTPRRSKPEITRHLKDAFSTGVKQTSEITLERPDRTKLIAHMESVADAAAAKGRTCRTILTDVTEARKAQRFFAQLHRLERMAENLPVGSIYVEEKKINLNRAAEEITGYTREELQSREEWFTLLHGKRKSAAREQYESHRRDGFREVVTFTITRKDGQSRIIDFAAHAFDHHEIWLLYDVTERRRAEADLRFQTERLVSVLDATPNTVLTVDKKGVIFEASAACTTMFGYRPEELRGKNIRLLLPSDAPQRTRPRALTAAGISNEVAGRRKDGSVFPIEVSAAEAGESGFLTAVFRDIGERRNLEAEVLNANEEERQRISRELHDSVNPRVVGLAMSAKTLAIGLKRSAPQMAQGCEELSQGLQEVIRELRGVVYDLAPFELHGGDLRRALRRLAEETRERTGVACRFRCPEGVEPADDIRTGHLFRIAQEAVHNVIKHARATRILISLDAARSVEAGLVLTITDNGIGLPPGSPADHGMGLRIMCHRANMIGARLDMDSSTGKGTRIRCFLPNRPNVLDSRGKTPCDE